MTATLHASCIGIAGRGVLIAGGSGRGKSDLAMRMVDRGADLVSDDYTLLEPGNGRLYGSAPERIRGKIEIRGVGIVELPWVASAPICLHLDLDAAVERLPDGATIVIEGITLPTLAFAALEPSAPIKLEQALRLHGIPL